MAIFSRDKTKGRVKRVAISLIVTLIFFLFIFPLIFRTASIKTGFVLWRAGNSFANIVDSSRAFFARNESLHKENELLKSKIQELELQKTLPPTTDNVDTGKTSNMLFPIIAKPFKTGSDTIILTGVPNNLNSYIGNIVTTKDDVPVGFVTQVVGQSVYVKLFSYAGNKVTLRQKDSGVDFDLVGRSGGNFYFEANQDVPVSLGTFFYIPNFSLKPVVRVAKIVSRKHDPEKVYLATLVVNYNSLDVLKLTEVHYVLSN